MQCPCSEEESLEIGRVTAWVPGRQLAFTWRQADWAEHEQIAMEIRFEPDGAATRVSCRISGWDRVKGGAGMTDGYSGGMKELLGWYQESAASR